MIHLSAVDDLLKLTHCSPAYARDTVVETVKQWIIRGDLAPGQRLVEADLCEIFDISRGTVRNALMDLAYDGWVERLVNRGARVRVVRIEEALQIAQLRMAVECLCVAKAAERISEKDILVLREYAEKLKCAAADNDAVGFAALTHDICDLYVTIADNAVIKEVLTSLRARNARHRFRLILRPGRAEAALPYWLERINAICNRDPNAARDTIVRHSRDVQDSMKALARETAAREFCPAAPATTPIAWH